MDSSTFEPLAPVHKEQASAEPPTLQLVRKAQSGDESALNDLLERYRDRLKRIARIRLSAELQKTVDASDILQDVMLVAFRRLKSFEPRDDASLIHWLSRILENQIRDRVKYARAQKRDVRRQLSLDVDTSPEGSGGLAMHLFDSAASSPSDAAQRAELAAIHDGFVEELAPDQREVILLRDYAGGSWEFVGEHLGRSPEAARELHRRATVRLATRMAPHLQPPE